MKIRIEQLKKEILAEYDKRMFQDVIEADAWLHFDVAKGCNCHLETEEVEKWLVEVIDRVAEEVKGQVVQRLKELRYHDDIHTSENLGIQSKVKVVHKDTLLAVVEGL